MEILSSDPLSCNKNVFNVFLISMRYQATIVWKTGPYDKLNQ